MDSGTIIGVEAMDSAWAASEGVVSGAGSVSYTHLTLPTIYSV